MRTAKQPFTLVTPRRRRASHLTRFAPAGPLLTPTRLPGARLAGTLLRGTLLRLQLTLARLLRLPEAYTLFARRRALVNGLMLHSRFDVLGHHLAPHRWGRWNAAGQLRPWSRSGRGPRGVSCFFFHFNPLHPE